MNKDNPLTQVLSFIIVVIVAVIFWAIGKAAMQTDEKKDDKKKVPLIANIFYVILGALILWVLSEFWFSTCGRRP